MPPFIGDSVSVYGLQPVDSLQSWTGPSAEGVFGAGSWVAAPVNTATAPVDATAVPGADVSTFYSAGLVACLVWWCLVVYVYRDYIAPSFGILRGGLVTEKLLDKQNRVFNIYLNWAVAMGGFALGLACLRFVDTPGIILGAVIWGVVALLWAFQWAVLAAAGRLTLYREFAARLFYLRKIVAAAASVVAVPFFLLWALSGGAVVEIAAAALCAVGVVMLVLRTFMLFMRQRFSILLWFLYLCAVEILPVVTIVIAAGKLLHKY